MGPDPPTGRHEWQREAQRRTGRIWLEQRRRAWWWVLGFLVVLLLILLWLYALPASA